MIYKKEKYISITDYLFLFVNPQRQPKTEKYNYKVTTERVLYCFLFKQAFQFAHQIWLHFVPAWYLLHNDNKEIFNVVNQSASLLPSQTSPLTLKLFAILYVEK